MTYPYNSSIQENEQLSMKNPERVGLVGAFARNRTNAQRKQIGFVQMVDNLFQDEFD